MIEGWVVGEEGVACCVWERGPDVFGLKVVRAEVAQAGEGIVGFRVRGVAFCSGHKLVILVLGFFDGA